MKNILTTLLLSTVAAPVARAQFNKGNIMLGGTGSFGAGFGRGVGVYGNVHLQPRIGLVLTDRLVAGAGIGLGFAALGRDQDGARNFYSGSFQPFARYYFSKDAGKADVPKGLVPFAEVGGGVGASRFRGATLANRNAYAAFGFNKFFNEFVALEASLTYGRQWQNGNSAPLRSGPFGGSIGFQIFLNRSKRTQTESVESSK